MKGNTHGNLYIFSGRRSTMVHNLLQTTARTHHAALLILATTSLIWTTNTQGSPAQVQDQATETNTAEIQTDCQYMEEQLRTGLETVGPQGQINGVFNDNNHGATTPNTSYSVFQTAGFNSVFTDDQNASVFNVSHNALLANGLALPQTSVFKQWNGLGVFTGLDGHTTSSGTYGINNAPYTVPAYVSDFAMDPTYITGLQQQVLNGNYPTGLYTSDANHQTSSVFRDTYGNSAFTSVNGYSYLAYLDKGLRMHSVFTGIDQGSAFLADNPHLWTTAAGSAIGAAGTDMGSVFITNDNGFTNQTNAHRQSVFLSNDPANNNVANSVFLDPQGNSYLDDLASNTSINLGANNSYMSGLGASVNGTTPKGWSESYNANGFLMELAQPGQGYYSANLPGGIMTLAQLSAYESGIGWTTEQKGSGSNITYVMTPSYQGLTAMSTQEAAPGDFMNPLGGDPDANDKNWWQWTVAPSQFNGVPGYVNRWAQAFYTQPTQNATTGAWTMTPYLETLAGMNTTKTSAEATNGTTVENASSDQLNTSLTIMGDNEIQAWQGHASTGFTDPLAPMGISNIYAALNNWTPTADTGTSDMTMYNNLNTLTGLSNGHPTSTIPGLSLLTTGVAATNGTSAYVPNSTQTMVEVANSGTKNQKLAPGNYTVFMTVIQAMEVGVDWFRQGVPQLQVLGGTLFAISVLMNLWKILLWGFLSGPFPLKWAINAQLNDRTIRQPTAQATNERRNEYIQSNMLDSDASSMSMPDDFF